MMKFPQDLTNFTRILHTSKQTRSSRITAKPRKFKTSNSLWNASAKKEGNKCLRIGKRYIYIYTSIKVITCHV